MKKEKLLHWNLYSCDDGKEKSSMTYRTEDGQYEMTLANPKGRFKMNKCITYKNLKTGKVFASFEDFKKEAFSSAS